MRYGRNGILYQKMIKNLLDTNDFFYKFEKFDYLN
jgi:hypothetical protein